MEVGGECFISLLGPGDVVTGKAAGWTLSSVVGRIMHFRFIASAHVCAGGEGAPPSGGRRVVDGVSQKQTQRDQR